MSLTVEDAESSYLKGKAEFDEWKDQFEMRNQDLDGSTLILIRMKEPPG